MNAEDRHQPGSQAAVVVKNVWKSYGEGAAKTRALADVSLDVTGGELVMITGPSGSGKSSLMSLIGGLDRPDAGSIHIAGTMLGGLTRTQMARLRRRAMGLVFQDHNLITVLTAAENVALPLELDGVRAKPAREAALNALEAVGLADLADRPVSELSGGHQQRIAIARAVTGEKHVVLADEPTGSLDRATGEDTMALLRQQADAGAAVLVVTHEPQTLAWADRVIELQDGRLRDTEDPEDTPNAEATGEDAPALLEDRA